MIVIDDAAGMTKYIWDYLDIIVIGGKMDIVDDLRKDAYGERQSIREARMELGGLLEDAANEIERLRKALRLAGDRVEPLASFQQKDIGSSTIRVGEETKFSRDARSFNGEK